MLRHLSDLDEQARVQAANNESAAAREKMGPAIREASGCT